MINHSARATAVSNLAKKEVSEQQLIKITGHSSSQSIKPYLQLDSEHHQNIIESMRSNFPNTSSTTVFHKSVEIKDNTFSEGSKHPTNNYNNCIFNITNNNK